MPLALTQAPNNLPHFGRKDWDENSGMGGSLFLGEMGQMGVGVDIWYELQCTLKISKCFLPFLL